MVPCLRRGDGGDGAVPWGRALELLQKLWRMADAMIFTPKHRRECDEGEEEQGGKEKEKDKAALLCVALFWLDMKAVSFSFPGAWFHIDILTNWGGHYIV